MSDQDKALSRYITSPNIDHEDKTFRHTPLDRTSQKAIEERNLSDRFTDMYLMSSTDFREHFPTFLKEDTEITVTRSQFLEDESHIGVNLITADKPQIIYNQGAYPCTLLMTFDSDGNFAVIHMTRFMGVMDIDYNTDRENADMKFLQKFKQKRMNEDARTLITATNVRTEWQEKITNSIKDQLNEIPEEEIETLFVDGSRVYKDGDIPEGYAQSTKDHIQAVYFVPKALSKDGKNKLFLVGDHENAYQGDALWLISDFEKSMRKRSENS